MVIRCERCSTLYELDETLLAPDGSPVQCTRCDHVFTARPPAPAEAAETRAASLGPGVTPAELELAVAPASGAALDPPTPDAVAAGAVPPPSSRAESSGPRAPAHDPRYARGASPAVYRPTPGPTSVRAHPVLRRDTVGAFESRLRWSARLRWLVPAVALGLAVLAAGGFFLLRGRFAPGAADARAEGLGEPRLPGGPSRGSPRPPAAPQSAIASPPATSAPVASPPAASPGESPPGNVTPPARKTIAQRPPAGIPAAATPVPPDGASGAVAPVAAEAGASPSTPSPGGVPATARGLAPSALMPASIPDVAPTSGMPQIAPPGASDGSRHPAREPSAHEESVGGG